jgi:uncharacterized protein YmfQ (DUF2313 family)
MPDFQTHTLEQHQQALAQYAPNDRLFQAKNVKNTNLYKLFLGLGGEFTRVDEIFQNVWDNTNILTTNDADYISRWEDAVGIPDSIFLKTDSLPLSERKNNILLKLRSLNCLTEQDFIDLAAILGYTVEISNGINYGTFPLTFPFTFFSTTKQARFTMIVNVPTSLAPTSVFPLVFPFTLSSGGGSIIERLFNELKPANTTVIFNYIL